jgi:hypothetical protein
LTEWKKNTFAELEANAAKTLGKAQRTTEKEEARGQKDLQPNSTVIKVNLMTKEQAEKIIESLTTNSNSFEFGMVVDSSWDFGLKSTPQFEQYPVVGSQMECPKDMHTWLWRPIMAKFPDQLVIITF